MYPGTKCTPSRQWNFAKLSPVQKEHYLVAREFPGWFEVGDFKARYLERYPRRSTGSMLPSDFAWNNDQVAKDRFPSFLERVHRATYRFVDLVDPVGPDGMTALFKACQRLSVPDLSKEFFYKSVPLAVCDAVFSIAADYERVTRHVVARYAEFIGSALYADEPGEVITPSVALERSSLMSSADLATNILRNRQRTSSRSGILKAEALVRWLQVLDRHGVSSFADVAASRDWIGEVKKIPGQKNAVLSYFLMLAGDSSRIKPDRHIIRFCKRHGGRPEDLFGIARLLGIEPRRLDYAIWLHESAADSNS